LPVYNAAAAVHLGHLCLGSRRILFTSIQSTIILRRMPIPIRCSFPPCIRLLSIKCRRDWIGIVILAFVT
jgi:hypothetical protein